MQDDIASTIAVRLRVSLTASSGATRAPTRNVAAYELSRKGRSLLYRRGTSIGQAIECFQQAVALDPDYDLADREFRRSLELNPNYPQGRSWYGLGYLHWVCGRSEEARDVTARLVEFDPLSANVRSRCRGVTAGHSLRRRPMAILQADPRFNEIVRPLELPNWPGTR